MKNKTLMYGSILAAGIIVGVLCVGMVTGFSVAKPFISVDPLSDKNVGDKFTITGTTNLPAGTEILFQVYPASFEPTATDPQTGVQSGLFTGATGTVAVTRSSGDTNAWSADVDLSTFQPKEYLVNVSLFTGDTSKGDFSTGSPFSTTTFTVHPASGTGTTAGPSGLSDNAVAGGILIDPIPDTTTGDLLVVAGKTSLPVGTDLIVKVIPVSPDGVRIAGDYQNPENAAVTKVVKGSGVDNHFSVALDTRLLPPDEHIVFVSDGNGDTAGTGGTYTGSAMFNIIPGTTGTSHANSKSPVTSVFINPISDVTPGDPLTVTGTTNVPAGSKFRVLVIPASSTDYEHPELAATLSALKGSSSGNLFSVVLATKGLTPGEHILVVSAEDYEVTGSILFIVK